MGGVETLGLPCVRDGIGALCIVAASLGVRAGSCFLVMANQEREEAGLDNPVVHDTDMAIRTAVEAIRRLIADEGRK